MRLTGPATAGVIAGEPVQVWVTATVPAGAAAGHHAGAIEVRAAGGACVEIYVGVTVLPLALREPRQERFLWYRGTIDCAQPQHRVPEDVFCSQLADIRSHGFTAISLNERRPALVRRAARLAREAGFAGTVVLHAPVPAGITPADFGGLRPVVYVSDEIDVRGEEWHDGHRRNLAGAAGLGLPTMASIADAGFLPRLAELGPVPDVVSVYLPRSREFVAGRVGGVYYHWAAHMEKPNVHRVLAGFYLWKSGAAGIAPYCYQHLPVHPNSPYDDFDDWEPGFVIGGTADDYKDHLATYPARTGVVPTLQWEGMGEGITDLRYVTTVDELLVAADAVAGPKAEECVKVRATLDELAAAISLTAVDVASETSTEPYPHLTGGDLSRFRARLASHALALQAIAGDR